MNGERRHSHSQSPRSPSTEQGSRLKNMKPRVPLKFSTSQNNFKGDVFDDPDYEKLTEKGEIHLGEKVITVSAGLIQTGKKLGSGQYGHVYRCCIKGHEQLKLAYKDICLDASPQKKKQIVAELEVTQKVNQCPDYAVQTYCQITSGINLWLIMELMDLSAHDLIVKSNSRSPKSFIPEPVVRSVSHACVQCLNFLKSIDLMHRDVKPSNILLRIETGEVKLGDFGICGKLENSMAKSKIYQYNYLAPERIMKDLDPNLPKEYTVKSDIWAVGITTFELATGEHPFYVKDMLFKTWKNIVEQPHTEVANKDNVSVSADMNEFVNLCMQKDPSIRPSYPELLNHPFIKCFDRERDLGAVSKYCQSLCKPAE